MDTTIKILNDLLLILKDIYIATFFLLYNYI